MILLEEPGVRTHRLGFELLSYSDLIFLLCLPLYYPSKPSFEIEAAQKVL